MGERLCRHVPIQPSWGNIGRDKKEVKGNRKSLMVGQNASKGVETIQNGGNQPERCQPAIFSTTASEMSSSPRKRKVSQSFWGQLGGPSGSIWPSSFPIHCWPEAGAKNTGRLKDFDLGTSMFFTLQSPCLSVFHGSQAVLTTLTFQRAEWF